MMPTSLYLDDGHTLIVVDAPAEGQADGAGCLRSQGGNANQKPGSFPRSRSRVPEPGLAPVGRAS
jgi:hypothetical protein